MQVAFSPAEGGAVCRDCLMFSDTVQVGSDVLSWAHWLMMSTFDEIAQREVPRHISFEILHLCQAWVREHVGSKLKSLEFLFTCGLF